MTPTPSADTQLLVLDSLHGLANVPALTDQAIQTTPVSRTADDALSRLEEWTREFIKAQRPATLRAVRSDWQQYIAWCEGTKHSPLPASIEQVEAFLRNAIDRGRKRATIQRYAYTIGLIHDAAGLPNPIKDRLWKQKWKQLRSRLRESGGLTSKQAGPMTGSDVAKILKTLGDSPRDLRDAALIALASDTLLRESELVAVKTEHFAYNETKNAWSLFVPFSKANQDGKADDYRFVALDTRARIERWLGVAGIESGHVFRPIGGRPKRTAKSILPAGLGAPAGNDALGAQEVARIFRRRARAAGLKHARTISGHSARVGTANDLINNGATTAQIQDAGGWGSPEMVTLYTRRSKAGMNAVADLRKTQAVGADHGLTRLPIIRMTHVGVPSL